MFYSAFHGLGVWFILEAGTYLMSLCPLPLGVSTPWTWRCSAAGCSWFRARSTWCSAKRFSALKCTCIMSAISLSLAFHVASPALQEGKPWRPAPPASPTLRHTPVEGAVVAPTPQPRHTLATSSGPAGRSPQGVSSPAAHLQPSWPGVYTRTTSWRGFISLPSARPLSQEETRRASCPTRGTRKPPF